MPAAVIVSYRLGYADGVSIEAAKWIDALRTLGYAVRTVAGEGHANAVLPGLAIRAAPAACPSPVELEAVFADAEIVIVENLCSLPLNPAAGAAVALALSGRRAILRHHDLPWQRERLATWDRPIADDPAWRHVCINDLSRRELADRGIDAHVVRNHFAISASGDRTRTRAALGLADDDDRLVLQPTRAIARKGVPLAITLAEALHATYWLAGPVEEDFGSELDRLRRAAGVRTIHLLPQGVSIDDAYAACDVVAFPSTWEGFGNPTIESAVHRKPLAVAHFPVLDELRNLGFRWFDAHDPGPIAAFLAEPDDGILDNNAALAREHFDLADLPARIAAILAS